MIRKFSTVLPLFRGVIVRNEEIVPCTMTAKSLVSLFPMGISCAARFRRIRQPDGQVQFFERGLSRCAVGLSSTLKRRLQYPTAAEKSEFPQLLGSAGPLAFLFDADHVLSLMKLNLELGLKDFDWEGVGDRTYGVAFALTWGQGGKEQRVHIDLYAHLTHRIVADVHSIEICKRPVPDRVRPSHIVDALGYDGKGRLDGNAINTLVVVMKDGTCKFAESRSHCIVREDVRNLISNDPALSVSSGRPTTADLEECREVFLIGPENGIFPLERVETKVSATESKDLAFFGKHDIAFGLQKSLDALDFKPLSS